MRWDGVPKFPARGVRYVGEWNGVDDSDRFSPEWWAEHTEREPNTGCHLWIGGVVCKNGYGRVKITTQRSPIGIHRVAYEQHRGPIPPGMIVCHSCDTPSCVNPDHLFVGTHKDNLRDMFFKGRARVYGLVVPKGTVLK